MLQYSFIYFETIAMSLNHWFDTRKVQTSKLYWDQTATSAQRKVQQQNN